MQIGEVAARTDLSLRTIRHYEEVELVVPSARSQGGFRLYAEQDIARLLLIRRMKPLGFSLEQTRDLLEVSDRLDADDELDADTRKALSGRISDYEQAASQKIQELRVLLERAEELAGTLRRRIDRAASLADRQP
jgi:DNA-binding transcriptional MerR regulator